MLQILVNFVATFGGMFYFFKRIFHVEADSGDLFCLAHAVDTRKSLFFDGGIPMWFHEICARCNGEVKSFPVSGHFCQSKGASYPTAPQDKVRSMTRTSGSLRKLSIAACLCFWEPCPSKRTQAMDTFVRPLSTKSRVEVQNENTIL